MSTHRIEFQVNGESHSAEVASRRLLSDFLRDGSALPAASRTASKLPRAPRRAVALQCPTAAC